MASRKGSAGYALIGVLVCLLVLGLLAWAVVRWWRNETLPAAVPARERCVATVAGQTAELALDQAHFAAIISGVSVQRGLPPRAATIALATAFQESDMRNIDYGDRDSIGLFQQRPSQGWGTVEQIMDPHYATNKFYDALVKVPSWQTGDVNDVAQQVQRSGVPDGYRKHVERARILASALSGETEAAFTCLVRDPKPANPEGYRTLMRKTYGGMAPVTLVATPPGRADVSVANARALWAVAAATQAWAAGHGIGEVAVGDRVWTSSSTTLPTWSTSSAPASSPGGLVARFR